MKRYLVLIAVLALVAGTAMAQVTNTKHDLSSTSTATGGAKTNTGQICVFCHTPHQASTAAAQDPLWNHTLSSNGNYGIYGSDTLNAAPTNFGGGTAGSANASQLCMSCHDGTISVASLWNVPNDVSTLTVTAGTNVGTDGFIDAGPAYVGTSLVDDHPVNFTYNGALATADGGLATPVSTAFVDGGTVPLFNGTVQCATCHDPHNSTNVPFLVQTVNGSTLCKTCHNNK